MVQVQHHSREGPELFEDGLAVSPCLEQRKNLQLPVKTGVAAVDEIQEGGGGFSYWLSDGFMTQECVSIPRWCPVLSLCGMMSFNEDSSQLMF